jgi:hypothetical protein
VDIERIPHNQEIHMVRLPNPKNMQRGPHNWSAKPTKIGKGDGHGAAACSWHKVHSNNAVKVFGTEERRRNKKQEKEQRNQRTHQHLADNQIAVHGGVSLVDSVFIKL